jgi:pre-rRNA-processing protein IPI3
MLTESVVASVSKIEDSKTTSWTGTPFPKDASIFEFSVNPRFAVSSVFKKSSTVRSGLALSDSHVFAAQTDKAAIHVYERVKGKQEATIPLPEKATAVETAGECGELLVIGTDEGNVLVWSVRHFADAEKSAELVQSMSGRLVKAKNAHIQAVTAIAVDHTSSFVLTGSADSTVLVWALASLLSYHLDEQQNPFVSYSSRSPYHSFTAHRGSITGLATGHSQPGSNIAISISEDRSALVWSFAEGLLLGTYILNDVPRAIAVDHADRAFYVGFDDGSVQILNISALDDGSVSRDGLVQPAAETRWKPPTISAGGKDSSIGGVLSLSLSFDATHLISGHGSGKIGKWNISRGQFHGELCHLPGPVSNVRYEFPAGFASPPQSTLKQHAVVKPKIEANMENKLEGYTAVAELTGPLDLSPAAQSFNEALHGACFPPDLTWASLRELESWRERKLPASKKSLSKAQQAGEDEDDEDFISLAGNGDASRQDGASQHQIKSLQSQLDSLRRTHKEQFKALAELEEERDLLKQELEAIR